jgi:hypothetical protein
MVKQFNSSYITVIPNSGHRIGHKLDDLITGFILAEWHGLKYLHSPLPDQKWEDFFGFGENETPFSENFREELPLISCTPFLGIRYLPSQFRFFLKHIEHLEYRVHFLLKRFPVQAIRKWRRPNFWDGSPLSYFEAVFKQEIKDEGVIFCFQKGIRVMLYQVHRWGNEGKIDPNIYSRVIQKLREKYFGKEHPAKFCYFDSNHINVAVHIRRDDASVENQRFLPLSYYESLLGKLDKFFKDELHEFHIYSSGSDDDMNQIRKALDKISDNFKYHFNESAMEAIHHMAVADILVVGNSSFSHWPGFLSKGVKLYHPHFHMYDLNEDEWVVAGREGDFDEACLRSLLSKHNRWKLNLNNS